MKHISLKEKTKPILLTIIFCLLACGSMIVLKLIFDQATDVIIEEHDRHLYDLAYSVDVNLANSLNRVQDELAYDLRQPDIRELEQAMEYDAASRQEMLQTLQNSLLAGLDGVKYIMIYKGDQKILCSVCDDDCTMQFLDDNDYDSINVCYDEEEDVYYITLAVASADGTYTYYVLLDMDTFYETMVADAIKDDNWVVLYDEGNGLLLQNHQNQPSYKIMTKTEIEERQDGYTILNHYQEQQKTGAETYTFANPDETVTPQRIVVLPTNETENGHFAIAIAMNSAETYTFIHKMRLQTILVLLFLTAAAAILAAVISYYKSEEKHMEDRLVSIKKENELEQQLVQAQVRSSVRQMQPHFLYNALSSIREIVLDDPEYAADLIFDFTIYLRACIHAMGKSDLIPFSKEMENIQAYVNIEKMRFGEKLRVVYEIGCDDFLIVPLSIQPLVENAIRHGICKRGNKIGTVTLSTEKNDHGYLIRVEDDGSGFDYDAVCAEIRSGKRDSTGLTNTCLRLENMLHATVDIQSAPGKGAKITVLVPFSEQE